MKRLTAILSAVILAANFIPATSYASVKESYSGTPYENATLEIEDGIGYLTSSTDLEGESFYTSLDETEYELKVFSVREQPEEEPEGYEGITYSGYNYDITGEYLVVKEKPLTPPEGMSEEERVYLWDDYLSDPLNYGKLCKAKLLDVTTNRNFQTAVEDKYDAIKYIGKLRQTAEEEELEINYTKLTKVWDYKPHDFPFDPPRYERRTYYDEYEGRDKEYDEEVFDYRKPRDESEARRYGLEPEWTPCREWRADTSSETYWYHDACVTNVRLGDLLGELTSRGTYRWEVPFAFIQATLAYAGAHNDKYWDGTKGHLREVGDNSIDGFYLSDATVQSIISAYSYDFEWYFTYEPWSEYESFIDEYHEDSWEKMEEQEPITVEYDDMEKYSFIVDKAEIGKEVPERPAVLGTEAYIEKKPQNAPKSISNIFEYVEYIYEEIDPEEDGDYGRAICTGRNRYINGSSWYRFMQRLCHNEFDWDDFEETLMEYTHPEEALELFSTLKRTYESDSSSFVCVAENEIEDALGSELPHLFVRLGKELSAELAELPATWGSGDLPDGWTEYTGPILAPNEFIQMVAEYAQEQYHTRDNWVLPSVCIAQACLETGYGKSKRMMNSYAIFGIKATRSWVDTAKYGGLVYSSKTKECYDGQNLVSITDTFRAYSSFSDSVSDYYDLICNASRYSEAVNNPDALSSITAIRNGGYATAPNYINSVYKIIQMYDLTQYDV